MGRDSRIAMVRIGGDDSGFRAKLRNTEKASQTWAMRVKGQLSSAFRGAFGGLGGIAGLAGIAGFGAMAREVKRFNDRLVRLQVSANKSRGEMLAFNSALQQTATATGASQDEILAGAQKYTELTGKFDEFAASMDTFAKANIATGATMESLVAAAAALSTNLNVKPDAMLAAFDALASQGKAGKIEIRDMAAELPGLTGQFSQFGTVGAKGVVEIGAVMQLMARGFGNASETATGMASLMTAMVKNSERLKAVGVEVFTKGPNGVRQLRDFADIAFELIEKSKGDPKILQHVLGRQEALQALIPLMQAGRGQFEALLAVGGKGGTIMTDFGIVSESAGGQLAKAGARLKQVFNEALLKNLDAIVHLFQAMVDALKWIGDHPEALAGIALLWKGGGILGAVGASYGGGMGGGAGLAAAAAGVAGAPGGVSRAAGWLGYTGAQGSASMLIGGGMQGAAFGYMLSKVGQQFGDEMDTIESAGLTAAGALASLPGPIGLLGKSLLGLDAVTKIFMAGIDEREKERASRTIDQYFFERGKGLGVSGTGDVLLSPDQIPMTGKHGEMVRANAQSVLQEGITQGFIKTGPGGTFNMDKMAMSAFVDAQKGLSDDERARAKAMFGQAHGLMARDPVLKAFVRRQFGIAEDVAPQSPFGTGLFKPNAGIPTWQEQLQTGAYDESPGAGKFQFGAQPWQGGMSESQSPEFYRQPAPLEVVVRVIPLEGYSTTVENDKGQRRGGR